MNETEPWPGLLRRVDALAGGLSDGELARLVRRGDLERLQRGAFLSAGAAVDRHRAGVVATVAGLRRPGVVSHASAAVLHGLPLWRVATSRVHLIRRPPAAGSGSARVHLHVARLPEEQVTLVDGLLVTDPSRTVVDLARTVPFESAVVTADAALAAGAVSVASLRARLAGMGAVPGVRRAARVLEFADGRSESVGESRSRVLIRRLGLPAPDLQVRVHHLDGDLIGRSDFGWHEHRILAEFDGRVKYGRALRPGQHPGDVVFEEKLREDAMRDAGWEMARWTWADLDRPPVVGARLRRAFARGARAG
ncbi:type IV toxin-antitoxin system AbiEi family antitoxin domain-containing protein [Geodermatophilus sp. SYSU D01186]